MVRPLTPAAVVVLLLFTIVRIGAQDQGSAPARITGQVVDASGAVLPGVEVTLTGAGDARATRTGNDGRYVFDAVKPYPAYTISGQLPGFIPDTQSEIAVRAGETSTVELVMEVGCIDDLKITGISTLERLAAGTGVAHVRTSDTVVDRHDGCGPRRITVVVAVASLSPAAPSKDSAINLVGETGRLQANKDYLVVLGRPFGRKYPFFGAYWVRDIVGGRISGTDTELDIRDGMSLDDASRQLRELIEKAIRDRR